jgi:hypothetical protein
MVTIRDPSTYDTCSLYNKKCDKPVPFPVGNKMNEMANAIVQNATRMSKAASRLHDA